MKLVNVADHFLRGRWPRYPAKDMPVNGADHHRAAVVQLHDMRQIRLTENMYHRNAGGSKMMLYLLNQFRFRQRQESRDEIQVAARLLEAARERARMETQLISGVDRIRLGE